MNPEKKKFRISSALKDIIGRELITNDFIAVFELVKNSFDAYAKRVDIIFQGLNTDQPKLVIVDDGKGMDRQDLEEKWLFVAYSAKKEGREDYRDKIQSKRIHAGAKGIGRFSCDRLGRYLTIYSKKHASQTMHKLEVDWEDFERDMHDEFIKIPVTYTTTRANPYDLKKGTALEITGFRDGWDRGKLLKLKHSLEKLINPNQGNDARGFSIYLDVPTERPADRKVSKNKQWEIVNGKVKNFLFEDLDLKTTQVAAKISSDGDTITTRLTDRGHLIYEIVEKNPFQVAGEKLHDIAIHLFALSKSAKAFFTRHMGVRVVEYGSVFLYKNGFRIHPVGDVAGGDIFAIDHRKQQMGSRVLGTRDVIGRVEIDGENPAFRETTSRDGGLFRNDDFGHLQTFFIDYALKRLEKFAIDVIQYVGSGEHFNYKEVNRSEALELIKGLTRSEGITDFKYDPKLLDILAQVSEQSLKGLLTNLKRVADETGNEQIRKDIEKAERRLAELQRAKEQAEADAERLERERRDAEERANKEAERAAKAEASAESSRQEAKQKTSQNLFLRSLISQDVANITSLHHHIGIAAGAIENYVQSTTRRVRSGKALDTNEILQILERISYQAKKITSTARFATKANFLLEAAKVKGDLSNFIEEYILNICNGLIRTHDEKETIVFRWTSKPNISFPTQYRPLEMTIILDNLISNARKAKAKTIEVAAVADGDLLEVVFKDDGIGVKKEYEENIFELGYTTTNGSGLGLYQVEDILKSIGGTIAVTKGIGGGAGFKMRIPKA